MKNKEAWRPTKVIRIGNKFKPSPQFVFIGSQLTVSRAIQEYETALAQYASGSLLDMGCGHVPYYEMYKSLVQDVTCVDWDNSLHKSDFVDEAIDLNQPLPLGSEIFDTVLLTDVLEHIFNPIQLVREISRILRPGGNVIIGVPFLYWLHEQPHDFYRYTEYALRQMCTGSGLTIVRLTPYGGAPEVLADIVAKCLAVRLRSISTMFVAICRFILRLKAIQSVSHRTAPLFPLGYIVVARKEIPE
jgi:SAM-dependent methyltransferase